MNPQGFRSTHTQNSRNASGQVLCTTRGEPCISRIANTEDNRGRKFYKCPDTSCGFFAYVIFWTPLLYNILFWQLASTSYVPTCWRGFHRWSYWRDCCNKPSKQPSENGVGNGDKNLDGSLPRSPVQAHVIPEANNNSSNRFNNATIVEQAVGGAQPLLLSDCKLQ